MSGKGFLRSKCAAGAQGCGYRFDSDPDEQGRSFIASIPLIEVDQGGLIAKISFVCCATEVLAQT